MLSNHKLHTHGKSVSMGIILLLWVSIILTGCSSTPIVWTPQDSISVKNIPNTSQSAIIPISSSSGNIEIKPQVSVQETPPVTPTKELTATVRSKIEQSTAKSGTAKDAFLALWKSLSVDDNKDELIKVLEAEAKAPGKSSDWDSESEYNSPEAMRAMQDSLDAVYAFFRSGNGRPLQEGLLTMIRDDIRIDKCSQNGKTGRSFICKWDASEIETVQAFLSKPLFVRPWSAPEQYKNTVSGVTALLSFGSGATLINLPR